MNAPADRAVVHAYRHLYRQGLKACHYASPARYMLIQSLRKAYRSSPAEAFDATRIQNTLRFLERATEVAGMEHKIFKNLLMTRYWEEDHLGREVRVTRVLGLGHIEHQLRASAFNHYNLTLDRLNESLGTCLK
ncbi:Complex 1 LYR protein [Penicillium brevicompactum]|uniref:Complex 1 LYR protein n=1 Tax=Penicillium brevicompactum TaxID=5074 RepID=A0A9W9UQW4_PENBR|nr:Complex 1 LYR protein [Penicillium brevicompactum]